MKLNRFADQTKANAATRNRERARRIESADGVRGEHERGDRKRRQRVDGEAQHRAGRRASHRQAKPR